MNEKFSITNIKSDKNTNFSLNCEKSLLTNAIHRLRSKTSENHDIVHDHQNEYIPQHCHQNVLETYDITALPSDSTKNEAFDDIKQQSCSKKDNSVYLKDEFMMTARTDSEVKKLKKLKGTKSQNLYTKYSKKNNFNRIFKDYKQILLCNSFNESLSHLRKNRYSVEESEKLSKTDKKFWLNHKIGKKLENQKESIFSETKHEKMSDHRAISVGNDKLLSHIPKKLISFDSVRPIKYKSDMIDKNEHSMKEIVKISKNHFH